MDSAEGTPPDLILDYILVDMVLCLSVLLIIRVFTLSVQRLLHHSMLGSRPTVMSQRALVGRRRTRVLISQCPPRTVRLFTDVVYIQMVDRRWPGHRVDVRYIQGNACFFVSLRRNLTQGALRIYHVKAGCPHQLPSE